MTLFDPPILGIVVPCYNEAVVFPVMLRELKSRRRRLLVEEKISEKSFLFFVDDGSSDSTWSMIAAACAADPGVVRGLKLARNSGHQNALLAGLMAQIGKADAVISLDADLQDDVATIDRMVELFNYEQADIVFGVRNSRHTDTVFKRASAAWYYRLMLLFGAEIVPEHADFRLMSDRAIRALSQFGESHVFLRGLVVQLGLRTAHVYFDRQPRAGGKSKYNMVKMIQLAIDGITSFSVRPLRIITLMGVLLSVLFVVIGIWTLVSWIAGETVQGWTSLMLLFLLISSFQTLALGIIGEYVGKTYIQAKTRPRFIIEKEIES
jgi:glycosyltransferase involved in cell wall biosynthesis